ncbi:vWA domain-containing protein [uncultured Gimesia sp.]|uniref:vWA domain-containing protein n=1 Tax=uncultured Gimesia sp. TaxID=1678688 RepID=UPI002609FDFF|nr:vWA domain-containing protein [uncultured Gimesia sp.]
MSVVNSARDVHVDEIIDVEPRNWLNLKEVPAWFISLGVHLLILFALASITRITLLDSEHAIISSIEEIDPDVFKLDPTISDVVGTAGDTNILSPSLAAAPQTSKEQQEAMKNQLETEIETPEPLFDDKITEPAQEQLTAAVDVTGETDRPGGVAGAIDRLTLEIAATAKEKKLLVVWLFDVSASVSKRRNEIADRFENVYKQLGILEAAENENSLKTAVASFGATTQFITKEPVSDVKEIVAKIRSIKPDASGDENVFGAVNAVSKRWLSYKRQGRRNMMVIVVTDEAGSDAQQNLEETILLTKRNGIKCYVVGNAAPFGQREVILRDYEIEPGLKVDMAVLETGPETVMSERVKMPFWGQTDYKIRQLSSGYGPYGLTRLCAETNGIYFITQETAGPKFEAADMRGYHPDYISIRDYQKKIEKNAAKMALVKTATATRLSKRRLPTPTLVFPATSDNVLRQAITAAQKPVSELDYGLNEIQMMLEQGLKDRKKITEPRWRANYDLALGRVLAIRVRTFGYNTILAEMKSSPKSFTKKGNNAWSLVPAKDVKSSPSVRKLGKQAKELLNGIIDNHPGTPWAYLAAMELDQPLGWGWQELKLNLDPQGNRVRTNNPRFAEEQRKRRERLKKMGIDGSKPVKI